MSRRWAVIPAAGIGRRVGGEIPKQYLSVRGRAVIEHSLARLLRHPAVDGVVVATQPDDPWWPRLALAAHERVSRVTGGDERYLSVLRGLESLDGIASREDWVLVHDAVRPCVRADDIDRLIEAAAGGGSGAVLGVPARDALKRADGEGRVVSTLGREGLWHALTPQMFRFRELLNALRAAEERGEERIGDESQAMEARGILPKMVKGHADNIKITWPEDLMLAELFLAAQEEGS